MLKFVFESSFSVNVISLGLSKIRCSAAKWVQYTVTIFQDPRVKNETTCLRRHDKELTFFIT